jgi:hypothetical protein
VLHQPWKVAETEVDDFDPLVLGQAHDLGGAPFVHGVSLSGGRWLPARCTLMNYV